jgi:hypothetical protein
LDPEPELFDQVGSGSGPETTYGVGSGSVLKHSGSKTMLLRK